MHSPPCANNAAAKCSHSACSACCVVMKAEGGAGGCEFHEAKEKAFKERKAAKRASVNAKKAGRRDTAKGAAKGGAAKV